MLNRGKEFNEKRDKPMAEIRKETRANIGYIRSKGSYVVERWECQWRDMKKTNRQLQHLIATEVRRSLDQVKIMSPERILSEVRNERLSGCKVCPIFKNIDISRDDIGEFMKAYAEKHNIVAQPLRSLIGSIERRKGPVGHTPSQMVPGTRLGGDQSPPSDRVHS